MKNWPAVEITWRDAHGNDETAWRESSELRRYAKPAVVRTVGLLAHESEAGVVVVLSHDKTHDRYGSHLFILAETIIDRRELV